MEVIRSKFSMKWKIFKDFLVKKNALMAFIKSCDCQQMPFFDFLEKLNEKQPDLGRWIDYSMTWANTKEGPRYWSRLDMELAEYCSQFIDYDGNIDIMAYNRTRLA